MQKLRNYLETIFPEATVTGYEYPDDTEVGFANFPRVGYKTAGYLVEKLVRDLTKLGYVEYSSDKKRKVVDLGPANQEMDIASSCLIYHEDEVDYEVISIIAMGNGNAISLIMQTIWE